MILETIQSKCISNVTTTNTLLLDATYLATQVPIYKITSSTTFKYTTFTQILKSATQFSFCTNNPFQVKSFTNLNLQAISDFKILRNLLFYDYLF
jgi:hypothetical protein